MNMEMGVSHAFSMITTNGVHVRILDDMLTGVSKEEMARREREHMRVAREIMQRYAARHVEPTEQTNG